MSKKLTLENIKAQSAQIKERFVEKTVRYTVDMDGESHEYEGDVDILVHGSRTWGDAKELGVSLEKVRQGGASAEAFMVSEMVRFSGEKLTMEDANALPSTLFTALLAALIEVNPSLFDAASKEAKAGNP